MKKLVFGFGILISIFLTLIVFAMPDITNLVLNGNFTGGSSSNWVYTEDDVDNVASSNFAGTGGNFDPGMWYFRLFDNSATATYTATGNLTNDGVFWNNTGKILSSATLQLAYKLTYTNFAPTQNNISVYLIKPDGSQTELFFLSNVASQTTYTYNSISIPIENFTQAGIYEIRLYNKVVSPTKKSTVQNYWDDIALVLDWSPIITPNITECKGFYQNIYSLGLVNDAYILNKDKLLQFVNSSLEPSDCSCSKKLLGLSEYNYIFSVNYTDSSVLIIDSMPIVKTCPSIPTSAKEVVIQKRPSIYQRNKVIVYLTVWK